MTAEEQLGSWGAAHLTDWLIKHHGAKEESRQTIESNIRSAYHAERAIGFVEGRAKNEVHIHFSLFGAKRERA